MKTTLFLKKRKRMIGNKNLVIAENNDIKHMIYTL